MSEHTLDPHAMIGAYVADALDDDERATFEEHLRECESCTQEVGEFHETLGELTWLVETPPPPALRASVLAEIATVRPLPPEEPVAEQTVPRPWPATAEPPASVDDAAVVDWSVDDGAAVGRGSAVARRSGTGVPDELAARRQRRVRRALIGLVAAALVAVVGLGGWVSSLVGEQRQQQVVAQQISQLLTAPDAKIYTTTLAGAPVSYVVSKERNQAVFVGDGVQSPGEGKTFQLWTIEGEQPTSQGLMAGGSGAHWFTGSVDEAQVMAVTIEPEGGSPAPTTDPLAVVEL